MAVGWRCHSASHHPSSSYSEKDRHRASPPWQLHAARGRRAGKDSSDEREPKGLRGYLRHRSVPSRPLLGGRRGRTSRPVNLAMIFLLGWCVRPEPGRGRCWPRCSPRRPSTLLRAAAPDLRVDDASPSDHRRAAAVGSRSRRSPRGWRDQAKGTGRRRGLDSLELSASSLPRVRERDRQRRGTPCAACSRRGRRVAARKGEIWKRGGDARSRGRGARARGRRVGVREGRRPAPIRRRAERAAFSCRIAGRWVTSSASWE